MGEKILKSFEKRVDRGVDVWYIIDTTTKEANKMYKDPNFEYYTAYQVQIRSSIYGGPCGDGWECYGKAVEDKAEAKKLQAKARRETGYRTRCFAFETYREKEENI